MTAAVIELSDYALRLTRSDGSDFVSPGYAVIVEDRVHIGDDARRRSRLYPLSSYNEFWHALNEQPLRQPTRHYRHNADLAFAHLQRLYEQAGRPEGVVFAVPGDLPHDRLALLLGLADACRIRALGLIDLAVAAAAQTCGPGAHVFVDLQLHRGVITQLRVDGEVVREAVVSVPDVGLEKIRDACAHAVAAAFIGSERFDPFAEAATEQALYDHLEVWLQALAAHDSIALELEFRGRTYQTRIERAPIARLIESLLAPLQTSLPTGRPRLLSHAFSNMPGALQALGAATIAEPSAIATACLKAQDRLRRSGEGLAYVTRLPATAAPDILPPSSGLQNNAIEAPSATHLLNGTIATPLGDRPVYLLRSGRIAAARDEAAFARIDPATPPLLHALADHAVVSNGQRIATATPVRPGDRIGLATGGPEFFAITVSG